MSNESGGLWGSDSADERPEWDEEEVEHYEEMPYNKEIEYRNSLKIGEYVRNISKNSMYYGRVGRIVDIDYAVYVKYEGEKVMGRHPARILVRSEGNYFHDDLFTMK